MSSSYYLRLDSALRTALNTLVTHEGLHIVGLEFTVMREKGQPSLLSVEILLCETEQKPKSLDEIAEKIVKNSYHKLLVRET